VRALLAVTLGLQAFAWWWLEGYPLADAVGYLDRARELVTTGGLQPTAENLRSVAFPLLFSPFFLLARALELDDARWIMPCARLIQMALALGFVASSVGLGTRLFGTSSGLAAGFVAATSPVLVVHSVSPVADVAAGLCVVRAAEGLLFAGSRRQVAGAAVWAGLGFVISYKTLAVQLLLGLLLFVRDRFHRPRAWLALAGGVGAFCLLQVGVDGLVYGRLGHSVGNYLADNVLGVFARALLGIGLLEPGKAVYRFMSELRGYELDQAVHWDLVEPSNQMDALWYVGHAYRIVVPIVAVLLPLGLVRVARGRRFTAWIPMLVVAGYVYLLSQKGNKSFRLLLPVLPFVAITAGAGWPPLRAWLEARGAGTIRLVRRLGLAVGVATAVVGFHLSEPRAYGGYWQAMDWVNERTRAARETGSVRVASAHYFAVFLRSAPGIEQVRYRFPVWRWTEDETSPEASEINRQIGRTLGEADWLLHSERLMVQRPSYLRALQNRYTIEAAFWERGFHSMKVGPVYVLRRRPEGEPSDAGRVFFTIERDVGVEAYRRRHELHAPTSFERVDATGRRRALTLLGVEAEPLPGSGLTWLTFHWTTPTGLELDWDFDTRLATDGHSFGLGHVPLYGLLGTSRWPRGAIVREGLLARTVGGPLVTRAPIGENGDEPARYRMTIEILRSDDVGRPIEHLRPAGVQGPVAIAELVPLDAP